MAASSSLEILVSYSILFHYSSTWLSAWRSPYCLHRHWSSPIASILQQREQGRDGAGEDETKESTCVWDSSLQQSSSKCHTAFPLIRHCVGLHWGPPLDINKVGNCNLIVRHITTPKKNESLPPRKKRKLKSWVATRDFCCTKYPDCNDGWIRPSLLSCNAFLINFHFMYHELWGALLFQWSVYFF